VFGRKISDARSYPVRGNSLSEPAIFIVDDNSANRDLLEALMGTLEVHRARVMGKMQAGSVADLNKKVLLAREN
jgi:FixJ family two-component response regulator